LSGGAGALTRAHSPAAHLNVSQRALVAARAATFTQGQPPGESDKAPIGALIRSARCRRLDGHRASGVQRAALVLAKGTAAEMAAIDAGRRPSTHVPAEEQEVVLLDLVACAPGLAPLLLPGWASALRH
jgi:hypothetical protein